MARPPTYEITITREHILAETEEPGIRVRLCFAINRIVQETGLTQNAAAVVLGSHYSAVSDLKRYKLHKFSTERLLRFLTAPAQDVVMEIRPRADEGRG